MIICTAEDYAAAETIILGTNKKYEFRARERGWHFLELREGQDRSVRLEAALIDILLSYDNEGGRVRVSGLPTPSETRLRSRLYHLRRHIDPEFFRDGLNRERDFKEGLKEKFSHEDGATVWDTVVLDFAGYHLDAVETALSQIQRIVTRYPAFKFLKAGRDGVGALEQMVKDAKVLTARKSDFTGAFSADAIYRTIDLCDPIDDEPPFIALSLLRESEQDEAAMQIKTALHDIPPDERHVILADYPSTVAFYEAYLKRVTTMPREAERIERLLETKYADSEKKDRELRQSDQFEHAQEINLSVGAEFMGLVKKIINDRQVYPQPTQSRRRAAMACDAH